MITRRRGLALALGAFGAAAVGASAAQVKSLHALAKNKGMRFGSTVSDGAKGSFNDPDYARLLTRECGLLVPETELKWQAVRPSKDTFDFQRFDHILAHAESRGMSMRGHNLLWQRPQWMPAWLENYDFGARPASEAARLLTTHINTICARYRGRILSYDVVNEAVLPEDGSLAETTLSRAMGGTSALLDLAFHTARSAAPGAQLVYNDYMSWENGNASHRTGVLKLLEGFRRRQVPIDALGVQSHLLYEDHPQEKDWVRFMNEVAAMGFDLLVTELDVNDQALPADVTTRDAKTAEYAAAYLQIMFSYTRLRDVLVWGMCDGASWLQKFKPLRLDGLPKRPCPYDASFKPKPLRGAIARAFQTAPSKISG